MYKYRMDPKQRLSQIIADYGLTNWMRGVRSDPEFLSFVEGTTTAYRDLPLKVRVHIAVSGETPACENGQTRPFANIKEGFGFCSRSSSCICLTRHKSAAVSQGKAKHKAARTQAAMGAPLLDDGDAKPRLKALIDGNPKTFSTLIARQPDLLHWVLERSSALVHDPSMSERCYVALHGHETATCHLGNRRKFYSALEGYENCCWNDLHCGCRKASHAATMRDYHTDLDPQQRKARLDAMRETSLERYGVANPAMLPDVQEKTKATNRLRYGVDHVGQNETIRAKIEATNLDRYGHRSHLSSETIKERIRQTNLDRYGNVHTMEVARAAYVSNSGYANPFLDPVVADKATQSMLERHGVQKALQSPVIREDMKRRILDKHGADNVMRVDAVKDRLRRANQERYQRHSPMQAHFSDETYAILQDREAFVGLFEGRSLREVSLLLGIGYDTARKYCYKYDYVLPKSSYETAIADYLRDIGIDDLEIGNRSLIKPYEVDILIPRLKLGIEFCGLYWHRDVHLDDRNYHRRKVERMDEQGYRLITIFEDEWLSSCDIVKSRLRHACGLSEKGVGARKCDVRLIEANEAKAFLDSHHIQGGGVYGFVNYGAFHDNQLVAVMTFSKARAALGRRKEGPPELLRFATDGKSYPGLASRLLKAFIRDYDPDEIISYADRRWSQGHVYRELGFGFDRHTDVNYWYLDFNKVRRYHRFLFRKDKIALMVENGGAKSEADIMKELGYGRIYDCGSMRFTWNKKTAGKNSRRD